MVTKQKKVTIETLRRGAMPNWSESAQKTERLVTTCQPELREVFEKVALKNGMSPATALRFAVIEWVDAHR